MRSLAAFFAAFWVLPASALPSSGTEEMTCSYEVGDRELLVAFRQTPEGLFVRPRREATSDWLRIWDATRPDGKRAVQGQAIEVWPSEGSAWRIRDNKGPAGYLVRFDWLRSWIRVQGGRPVEGWCIPGEHLEAAGQPD